jgi:hypothetical protein
MGYPVGIDPGAPSGLKTGIVIPVSRVQIILTLAGAALTLPVIWLLRAIVDSARSGDPFVPGNAARLRRIGWLVLMGDFLVTSSRSIALHHGITFPPIELSSLVMVLLIFVLARIFEAGARMRTEIQETI